jgi:hypothetical protein
MKVIMIDDFTVLKKHEDRWQQILEGNNNQNLYLDFEWIDRWWNCFGKDYDLFVICFIDADTIRGYCPLMKTRGSIVNKVLFIGRTLDMDLVVEPGYRKEAALLMIDTIIDSGEPVIVELKWLQKNSVDHMGINKALERRKIPHESYEIINRYLKRGHMDLDTYYSVQTGRKIMRELVRSESRLGTIAPLSYMPLELTRIDEMFEMFEKRWTKKATEAGFVKGEHRRFYTMHLTKPATRFEAYALTLVLGGKYIAFIYYFIYKDTCFLKRMAFDEDFGFLSPGKLLLKEKIKRFIESGEEGEVLSFGTGDLEYKKKWTNDHHQMVSLTFSSKHLLSKKILPCTVVLNVL